MNSQDMLYSLAVAVFTKQAEGAGAYAQAADNPESADLFKRPMAGLAQSGANLAGAFSSPAAPGVSDPKLKQPQGWGEWLANKLPGGTPAASPGSFNALAGPRLKYDTDMAKFRAGPAGY